MNTSKITSWITSPIFRKILLVLSILFIILTYFISLNPNSFISYGYFGIFIFNAVSSGILILPLISDKFNIFGIVFFSALGNIINTTINYIVGNHSSRLFSHMPMIGKIKRFMRRYEFLAVYLLSIVPFPIDINGLLSGYLEISYPKYILANFLGKLTVFYLVAQGIISLSGFF